MYYLSIIKELENYNKIVMVGLPRAGKTKTSKKMASFINYELIHTDDYMNKYTWEEQPKKLISIISEKEKYIIEGIQCYRILRTGVKLNIYSPDLIVNIIPKFKPDEKHKAMCKTLKKIYTDYLNIIKYRKAPKIIDVFGE
jgi:hypothetical protein